MKPERCLPYLLLLSAALPAQLGLEPLPAAEWTPAMARHLLHRAGFGGTAAEIARLHALGLHTAVAEVLDFQLQPHGPGPLQLQRARPDPAELRAMSEAQRREVMQRRRRTERQQIAALRQWWLRAMVETTHALQEKLTLFWHGHFAVEYRTVRDALAMQRQNDLLRTHAAGNFGELLHAIARDPAMLRYLDADRNVKGRPNENLAREIMELFAMGEGAGYTEADIQQGARALTGATLDRRTFEYRFRPALHDAGVKHLFGREGAFGPPEFVDLILQQPATARHIAGKLFRFFAHEQPDPDTITRLAALLRAQKYELAPLLENLFRSREFYSERSLGHHVKSPIELVIGTIRTLGLSVRDYRQIDTALGDMGQRLFDPPNVRGWLEGQSWLDTNRILVRHNAVAALLRNFEAAPARDGAPLPAPVTLRDQAAAVAALEHLLLARPLQAPERTHLIRLLSAPPHRDLPPAQRSRALVLLFTTLPEYQLN